MRRHAFSLVELLVVIAIIALLAGLASVGIAQLRRNARVVETSQRMRAISEALDRYLGAWSLPGDAAGGDFASHYWTYLGRRPFPPGDEPLLALPLGKLRSEAGEPPDDLAKAVSVADGFGLPILLQLEQLPQARPRWTERVRLIAEMGTPGLPQDDQVLIWERGQPEWTPWRYDPKGPATAPWMRR